MPCTYEHINSYEREIIAQMLREEEKFTKIAARLGRSPSSITREVSRNRSTDGIYRARRAQALASERLSRPRRKRVISETVLCEVESGLRKYWSPEQIHGRGALEGSVKVSTMSIYRFLRTPEGAKYRGYLRGANKQRRRRRKVHERIRDRVMIDKRPRSIEKRDQVGHWEGDTVRGPISSSCSVLTMVERASHYLQACLLSERNATVLNHQLALLMKSLPFLSSTVDNGMEFACHKDLSKKLGAPIFFAHPGCPWERGLNEQVNGLLRQFFPKGTNFDKVTPTQLRRAVDHLNNRPRKSLGYKTPKEVMQSHGFALVK